MKKLFSKSWNSSTQTRKQRKYCFNSPLHVKHKFMSAPLSSELKKENGFRSIPLRKGDTVKIKTGQFKGKTGKITKVSLAKVKAYVEGATVKRADGTDALYPIHPSNVEIQKLDLSDKLRVAKIDSLKKQKKDSSESKNKSEVKK